MVCQESVRPGVALMASGTPRDSVLYDSPGIKEIPPVSPIRQDSQSAWRLSIAMRDAWRGDNRVPTSHSGCSHSNIRDTCDSSRDLLSRWSLAIKPSRGGNIEQIRSDLNSRSTSLPAPYPIATWNFPVHQGVPLLCPSKSSLPR